MKTRLFLSLLMCCGFLPLLAQNSMVGTWQREGDTTKSVKIITPTHWMVITESTREGNPKKFIRAHGGPYTLNGDKYIETITTASWEDYDKAKTDYTVKVEGDKLHQKGLLTLPNATEIQIDEMWQKVNLPAQNTKAIGTWKRLSTESVNPDGQKVTKDNTQEKQMFIVTPTHYIWIAEDVQAKKFLAAAEGTYTRRGSTYLPKVELASWDHSKPNDVEVTISLEGDKMVSTGVNRTTNSKWKDTFQRVGAKPAKVASR